MVRAVDVVLSVALLISAPIAAGAQSATSQAAPVTITATITALDQATRMVTLKGSDGMTVALVVPKQLQNVKAGDSLDVTYYESLLVKVARAPKPPKP